MQRQSWVSQPSCTACWGGNPNLTRCSPGLQPPPTGNMVGNHPNISKRWMTTLGVWAKRPLLPPAPKDQARDSPKTWCQVLVVSAVKSHEIMSNLSFHFRSYSFRIFWRSHCHLRLAKQIRLFIPASETWSCMCTHHLCVYTLRHLTPPYTVHERLHTCTAPYIFVKEFHAIVNPWERWCLAKSRIQLLLAWSLGAIQISFQRLCSF